MGASGLALLIALGLLIWFWQDTLAIRESAIRAARETCAHQNLQFLDATVVFHRFSLARTRDGRLALRRTFLFSYSEDGLQRNTGFILTLGNHIEQVGL